MADPGQERPAGCIRLGSGVPGGFDGVPGTPVLPNEEGVELGSLHDISPSIPQRPDIECQ